MELMTAKGVRDFSYEEKILRNDIVQTLKENFEKFGFLPIETPIIERYDVLASKYAGGAEILKETFKFKDQGSRVLALRYDLTVPFARFVAMNPQLKMPFKRYQIERVFRDGPIKLGRYREFWQCDADIVGTESMSADALCIELLKDGFEKLKIPVNIYVNNIKILRALVFKVLKNPKESVVNEAILSLDKLKKIGRSNVVLELVEKGFSRENANALMELAGFQGSNSQKINYLKKQISDCEGVLEVETVLKLVKNVEFDITLSRGLSYYTGTIFEVYDVDNVIDGSLAAGGRYDGMIGELLGKKEIFPAVGCSFGLEPITEFFRKEKKLLRKTNTKIFIIPIKTEKESFGIAKKLRGKGINVDIDISGRGISKNLQFANYYSIPFVLFVGKQELEKNKLKLRNMISGRETLCSFDVLVKKLR